MRAAVYHRFGAADVLRVEDVPMPAVGRDEVLIRVHASTVSAADRRARARNVPRGLWIPTALTLGVFRPRLRVLGMDVAGVVEAVGPDVTRFAPGDEVIAMLGAKFGGHAEYARISQHGAITLKPRGMGFEDAVTLVFGGITARGYLNQVTLASAATVLVNGASGAVGTAAVQLAKHAGAHVTAVCSGTNRELVTALGADQVIDYTTTDFTAGAAAYDVVIDCVGNLPFESVQHRIKPGGALLLVTTDLRGLLLARRRSRRSGRLVVTGAGPYRSEDLAFLVELAESGRYRPVRERTYELTEVVDAHHLVDSEHKKGNVVLRIAADLPA